MNIDVVLTNAAGAMTPRPGISADAIRARFALEMVEAIKAKLGPNGRIGRLRIFDEIPPARGPEAAFHPLTSTAQLGRLRGLFEPGGQIEIVSPGGLTGLPAVQKTAVQGMGGGFGGFSGGGFGGLTNRQAVVGVNALQLSAMLGVPVRFV